MSLGSREASRPCTGLPGCSVGGRLHPSPGSPWGDVGFTGAELQRLSGMSSVLQRQEEPGGCAPGPRETELQTPDHGLAGPRGPLGPGRLSRSPHPKRSLPLSERSVDPWDTEFMHEHTPGLGKCAPASLRPRGEASAPLPSREGRRRRPESNSDISGLSRGLGLRLDK